MKYSIEQLVEKVNSILLNTESTDEKDGRVSNSLSVRRVRDYQSKGLLREPKKLGRNTYYDDEHIQQLVALRTMQSTGLTDSFMKSLSTSSPLYYQSPEVKEQVISQLSKSSYSELKENSVVPEQETSMKDRALRALNKCSVDGSITSNSIGASLSHKSINAATISSLLNSNSSSIPVGMGLEDGKNKLDLDDKDIFSRNFFVDPDKEKRYQQQVENRIRTPSYSNIYDVHDRVKLEIKTPYNITLEDKSKIIERLKDIINSI